MHKETVPPSLRSHLPSLRIAALLLLTASAAGALEYEIRETVPLADPNARLVAAGDTDGDGVLDLVLAIPENPATMWLAERDGASFVTRFTIDDPVELRGGGLVFDLDGDGLPEIVSGHGSDNTVRIWEADGDDSYVLRHEEPLGAKIEGRLQVGDSDGNGVPELIFGREGSPSQVILLEAQGNDNYLRVATLTGPGGNVSPSNVYDMDGDGLPELAMSDDGFNPAIERTRVFENRAEVYVEPSELLGVLVLGDTDGNGLGEIIGWDQATRWPRILESTGTGNEFVEVYHADGYASVPVDADADGKLELWRAIDEGSGLSDVLTLGRREGAIVVDIWNSGALFQGSAADIVDVKAIGDTNDDGRLEIAVQQGAELHILEAVQPDWVWTVPYAEYNAQVSGDSIGPDEPLLGSVRFGISLQNWAGWRGTNGDVLDPNLTLATPLPVAEVDATEFLVPGSEYEWQFPDIPDGGDSPGVGIAFDPAVVTVEYMPTFTLARTVLPLEIGYPGGPVTVTVDLTPQIAELDGEPLDILNVMASVEGQPGFDAQIVAATPLDPSNPDVSFHSGGAYWSIFDITVGQTYSLELTLELQLSETAKAVEYAPLVEGRAWYSASEHQTLGTTVSFPLDYGTWTWETTSEHTWGSRPTTMPRVGLAERVMVTPNNPPIALCQDVMLDVGEAEEAHASIDAGSYDPDGDPVNLGQQPPPPYGIGAHEVTLTVNDGFGAFRECTATVTVTGPPVTHVVTTTEAAGPGSLREAVDQANNDGRPTIITFDPSLAGQTIMLDDGLGLWEDFTTIDGDVDGDCWPDVELSSTGGGSSYLWILSSGNVFRGLIVNAFPVVGVYVGGNDNVIECNFIGTDATGTVAMGNGFGLYLAGESHGNRIGGPWPGSRNLISGNSWTGVQFDGHVSDNVLEGNLIGTDITGTNPLGNGFQGLYIEGASDNRIGPDNVIAFNDGAGIGVGNGLDRQYPEFSGLTPDAVEVFPVIDLSGDCADPFTSADGITPADAEGEPFFDFFGARFTGTLTVDTTADYAFDVFNVDDAVAVAVDGETLLDEGCCGEHSVTAHLEAGDHEIQVAYSQSDTWAHLHLEVGEVSGGGGAALATNGNTGGCAEELPGLCGELFRLKITAERNRITQNSIFENRELGIDLYGCEWGEGQSLSGGVTENDPGDGDQGPNGLLNYPEFTGFAELTADEFEVQGTAPPESTVEVFGAAADESGHGEGKLFLRSFTTLTGDFTEVVNLPPGVFVITATATDPEGNTSEFSPNLGLRPNEISVVNTGGEGDGSLSDAIHRGNVDGVPTIITFDPSLAGQTIELTDQLPGISEDGTVIDGDLDGDCSPDITLSGVSHEGELPGGLRVDSSNNVIRGLRFPDFDWAIYISGTHGNVVECTEILRAGGYGLGVEQGASDNRIGPGNVIAESGWVGVTVGDGSLDVFPEFEGLVPDATFHFDRIDFIQECEALHNVDGGPLVDDNGVPFTANLGARFTATLTVDVAGDYDFYVPNPDDEVRITIDGDEVLYTCCSEEASATVTLSEGEQYDFELAYRQGTHGEVRLDINGPGTASPSYGGTPGVHGEFFQLRVPTERNTITQNSIYDSGHLGINLSSCDRTSNDPGDADVGPNTWLNYPVFAGFTDLGDGSFEVTGTAPADSTVELFAAAVNESGRAEGKEYLVSVMADLNGGFTTTVLLPAEYLSITATATDQDGNTSEFSSNLGLRPNEISVQNTNSEGPGSLQDAIDVANSDGTATIITFENLPAGSTIELDDTLHIYDDETTIDGDLDGDCWPDIELSGEFTNGWGGIWVESTANVIRGLVINRFPELGIAIASQDGQPATGNVVECNFIGTDPTGTIAMGNGNGVYLEGADAFGNRVGGPAATSRNLISGNHDKGVFLAADGNIVEGNLIGTDINGSLQLGNGGGGVHLERGSNDNRIGPDNVIAWNGGTGVTIVDDHTDDYPDFEDLVSDFTGVFPVIDFADADCTSAFESADGIVPTDGAGNTFLDNFGARFTGTLSVGADGNYDFTLPDLDDNARIVVDGETVVDGCCGWASGSTWLEAGDHVFELDFLEGQGMATLLLEIGGPGSAALTTDGNTAGCAFAQPGLCGEFFQVRRASERNRVTANSMHDNGGLGIDLHHPGCEWGAVTPNDPSDGDQGANTLLNFPEFTGFTELAGDSLEVTGSAPAESTVEFFAVALDESGHGEGKEYLGSVTADLDGEFTATVTLPIDYIAVTATATDTDGNTSEFSPNLGIRPNEITVENTDPNGPGSLADAIDTANSDGVETIITFEGLLAGSTIELDDGLHIYEDGTTIDGDLDGNCWPDIEFSPVEDFSGWSGIWLESSDNVVRGLVLNRFPGAGLEISTYDEAVATGNVVECNFIGTDPSGTLAMGNNSGVYLGGDNTFGNRIGGPGATSRNLLSGNYDAGVYIWADGNVVEGNLIGTDITGTQPLGNGNEPVAIEGASGNRIGPDNVIAFNGRGVGVADSLDWRYPDFDGLTAAASGVFEVIDFSGDCITFANADGFVPTDEGGNPFIQHFGALFTGTLAVGEANDYTFELVEINDLVSVTVDGETILEEWCCGPYESTLFLEAGSHHLEVAYLQWDSSARLTFDVTGPGTVSLSTDQNTGGCPEGEAGLCGEFFELRLPAERNTITTNSIFGNQGLGINLPGCQGESVPNDPGDVDTGPNGHMNFPEVVSALADAGATVVVGSLETPSAELATIELFANEIADPSGYGEGQTWLGSLQPDALGAFSVTLPEVPVGLWITATATDQWGNTSEFSSALRVSETVRWATALYAAAQSSTSVQLTWIDPGYGETGFRVERSEDGETWVAVATVGHDDVGYLDETLVPATLYYYRVVAFDAAGDLRPSNRASATTFPAAAAKVCHQQVSAMHRGARVATPAYNGQHWAVVWMERNGAYDELYFQLFDATGAPAAAAIRLTESDSITQIPTLRWNGSSFGLIYGEHMRGPQGEFWSNNKFMRLDADGQPIRKEMLIVPGGPGAVPNQFDAPLVWDGTHWGFIAHRAVDSAVSATDDLVFYRLSEDGELVSGPIPLTDTPEIERDGSAAWSGNEYGLVWSEVGDTATRLLFQRMQSDGSLIDSAVVIAETAGGYMLGTSIVWDGADWAIAWSELQNDGSEAVLLQRLDPLGVPLAPAERISDDHDPDYGPGVQVYDEYPQLVAKPDGYAIYTLTYALSTGAWEMGRLAADTAGQRVGLRALVSDADGLNSLWNRVATDGTNDFLAYNESRSGTQEIAAVVVGPAGTIVSGPVELTSGHDPGVSTAWTVGANQPQVAAVAGGFAAVWRDVLGGGQIHASIFDSSGAPTATSFQLTTGTVAAGPVAVGVGASFAVAWLDETSGQITLDRYDATGASLMGETQLDGGSSPEAIAFSGEVYGVAWREGGGIRLQTVTADGFITGPPVAIEGVGNQLIQMQWVGAGWAIVARSWPDLYYALVDTDGALLVGPTPITNTSSPPRSVDLAWSGQELGVAWEEDRDGNGRQVWFAVLSLGGEVTPEVELWSHGRWPSLYWQDSRFHVTIQNNIAGLGGNLEIEVSAAGVVTPGSRVLSSHVGAGAAVGNGATAGFLYMHRAEAYFETTACLEDPTPAGTPSLSAFFDGSKVSLTWSAAGDPESDVIGYNLYRDGALIAENFATTFSFDDYGVVPDALYVYELRALNGAWLESVGGAGIETVATADTVEDVGGLLEEISTEVFTQVIEGILADPEIPDEIAADIQASLDDLIGNNGGLAANGAADKLEKANIVAALSMMRHAIGELQTAAAQGYDTSDLQDLVTSFARLSVLTVIRIEAETLGDNHPDVVAARGLVDQGDASLEGGDYLGAIDFFKDAVQALP